MPDESTPQPSAQAWQLVQQVYFPTAVYTVTRPDFLPSVRAVFDDYMAAARHKAGDDPDQPLLMSDSFFNDPRIADFAHHVANAAWNILREQGYQMQGRGTFFTEMWGQEHGKTSSMPEHVHAGVQMVGFYFLETPPGSSRIQIHDPRPAKAMISLPEAQSNQVSMASNTVSIKPAPGMLFFANGWLPHSLSRHTADAPMLLVHFNIGAQKVPDKLMPPPGNNAATVI